MFGSIKDNENFLESLFARLEGLNENISCGIAVPHPYLFQFSSRLMLPNFLLGAQNVAKHSDMGPFTGEVNAKMISEFGCSFSIVGHSERRSLFQESDGDVSKKILSLLDLEIQPIVCIGETLEIRDSGKASFFVENQVNQIVEHVGIENFKKCTLAYEPIWAIGTGRTATSEQIQLMQNSIRSVCTNYVGSKEADEMKLIYGGSVNPSNVEWILKQNDVDGVLVGGASTDIMDFIKILDFADGLLN